MHTPFNRQLSNKLNYIFIPTEEKSEMRINENLTVIYGTNDAEFFFDKKKHFAYF